MMRIDVVLVGDVADDVADAAAVLGDGLPIFSTDALSVASVRPQIVTAAPSAAATRAQAAPIPVPPPVTSTPQPSRPPVGFSCAGIALPRRSSTFRRRSCVT